MKYRIMHKQENRVSWLLWMKWICYKLRISNFSHHWWYTLSHYMLMLETCWGAKDAKSIDVVAWWDSRLSMLILDYPHILRNLSWFDKDFEKCLLNTDYQERESSFQAGSNGFMKDKSETAFSFNRESWYVPLNPIHVAKDLYWLN